jgi:hypothetical protein
MLRSIANAGAPSLLSSPSAFAALRGLSSLVASRYQTMVGGELFAPELPVKSSDAKGLSIHCDGQGPLSVMSHECGAVGAGRPDEHFLRALLPYVGRLEWALALFQPQVDQLAELLPVLIPEPAANQRAGTRPLTGLCC